MVCGKYFTVGLKPMGGESSGENCTAHAIVDKDFQDVLTV